MTHPDLDELRRFTLHIVLVEPEIHFNADRVLKTRNLRKTRNGHTAETARNSP